MKNLYTTLALATCSVLPSIVMAQEAQTMTKEQIHQGAVMYAAEAMMVKRDCPENSYTGLLMVVAKIEPDVASHGDEVWQKANALQAQYASMNKASKCAMLAVYDENAMRAIRKAAQSGQ